MSNTINCSGFDDMFLNSDEDFEPYGCVDINELIGTIYNNDQTYRAGFNSKEYSYDN